MILWRAAARKDAGEVRVGVISAGGAAAAVASRALFVGSVLVRKTMRQLVQHYARRGESKAAKTAASGL